MGEASTYDGYVGHLAATGVTYINLPNGQGVVTNAAVTAGAASAPEPWAASAGANSDPLQGLSFGELDVPGRLFDGELLDHLNWRPEFTKVHTRRACQTCQDLCRVLH